MKGSFSSKCYHWLLRSLQLQLYISYASWPLFLWWGIPLSLASPLGNILFSPFIALFLFVSSLIFISYFFCLPYSWLISLLNTVTTVWLASMPSLPRSIIITYATPPWWILGTLPIIGTVLLFHPSLRKPEKSIFALIIAFLCTGFIMGILPSASNVTTLSSNKTITLIHRQNENILIIDSHRKNRLPHHSWVRWTLPTLLATLTGKRKLTTVIVTNLTPATIAFVALLCSTIDIDTVVLPQHHKKELQKTSAQKTLVISPEHHHTIEFGNDGYLTINGIQKNKQTYLRIVGQYNSTAINAGYLPELHAPALHQVREDLEEDTVIDNNLDQHALNANLQ